MVHGSTEVRAGMDGISARTMVHGSTEVRADMDGISARTMVLDRSIFAAGEGA